MPKDNPYSVHPGVSMVQSVIAGMKAKTGRTLEEWIEFVQQNGPADEAGRRDWLKKEHGLGTNYAWWIAERSVGKGEEDGDPEAYLYAAVRYVDEMYADGKSALRPIYDALLKVGLSLGSDVKACPCKTIVPLYRKHVFAEIKPTTKTRIDLGFAFKDMPASGRLIDTGGFAKKDRITHRIPIDSVDEIDDEVKGWLRKAYELDGG